MKKFIKILYYIYITLIFILPLRINYTVYLASVVATLLTGVILIQYSINREIYKIEFTLIEKILHKATIGYIFYQMFLFLFIKGDLMFHIEKFGAVSLFAISLSYLRLNKDIYIGIEKLVKKMIVISIVSWGIFYIFKIARLEFVGKNIRILNFFQSQIEYGEVRFEWLTRHKSELAVLCLILTIYIKQLFKSKILKILLIICCFTGILLSKSSTTLILFTISLTIIVIIKMILYVKDINLRIFASSLYLSVFMIITYFNSDKIIAILNQVLKGRNIATLGSRTFIWESAMTTLKNNYWGYGKEVGSKFMANTFYDFHNYSNAHNTYIQEMLESGIVGGILFIIITLCILAILFKVNWESGIVFSCVILVNQMDIGMYRLNFHLMYLMIVIVILKRYNTEIQYKYKKHNNTHIEK